MPLDLRTDVPWWTPRDQAELEERTNELVDALFTHREENCGVCADLPRTGGRCEVVNGLISGVVEWRDSRERANRLRAVRLALAPMPRPNPIPIDRLVRILRETAP